MENALPRHSTRQPLVTDTMPECNPGLPLPALTPGAAPPAAMVNDGIQPSMAGIYIRCPANPIPGYSASLAEDIRLKNDFFPSSPPASTLWFAGRPLQQFSDDGLTEVIFRLCRLGMIDNDSSVRGMHLGFGDCTGSNLALLKGLGINLIRLCVTAPEESASRGLPQLQRAMDLIAGFGGFRLQAQVNFTTPATLHQCRNLLAMLTKAACNEIELIPMPVKAPGQPSLPPALSSWLDTRGFRCRGDRIFIRDGGSSGHRYGPWGFYNPALGDWLGLGAGASGIARGYMYLNHSDPVAYTSSIGNAVVPVAGWSHQALESDTAYRVTQNLFCNHRQSRARAGATRETMDDLCKRGWLRYRRGLYRPTRKGLLRLRLLCLEIYRRNG